MFVVALVIEVGGHIDGMHARLGCRCCAETSADGAATFAAARIIPAEARTKNT